MTNRSFANRLRVAVKAIWKPQSIADLDAEIERTAGSPTLAGVSVSENTALNFLALYACVRVKANTQAALSVHLYQRKDRGAERLTGERLYYLIHDAPNEQMTSVSWRRAISGHIDTWGNGYTWLDKPSVGRNAGRLQRMVTLKPDRIKVRRAGGRLKYDYRIRRDDGSEQPVTYDESQVLHIPGLGYDGLMGYSPVALARQAIGLGMSFEEFQARWVGQGTHPSGLVVPKVQLNQEAYNTWKAAVQSQYSGLSKTGSLMALNVDSQYTPFTVPLKDAEFLGLRRFQLEEMARLTGVPLVLVQDQEKTTSWGTGVEQIFIGYVMLEVLPSSREWEQRMNLSLLTEAERAAGWYFEFDLNSMMRGDAKSRGDFYKVMRETGGMNPNEIRQKENMNPRTDPGGEKFWDEGPSGQGSGTGQARAAMRPVLVDAAARILQRENRDIAAEAEKWTRRDDMDGFCGWLGGYWTKHRAFCVEVLTPPFTGLGQPEMAHKVTQMHVERLQSALKLAQTGGIDAIRECLEARAPSDMPGVEEELAR